MRKAYAILLLCLFVSCMSYKDYTSEESPQQNLAFDPHPFPDYSSYFSSGEWPSSKWWEMFEDQQLNLLIDYGLGNNYSLKSAQAQTKAAFEQALILRSKLFPTIDFNAKDYWMHMSRDVVDELLPGGLTSFNFISVGLNFDYELDLWGKNRAMYESLLGQANATLAEQELTKLMITTTIAKEYVSLKATGIKLALLQSILNNQQTLLDLTKKRVANRIDDTLNEIPLMIQMEQIQSTIDQQKAVEQIIKVKLNTLLGRAPSDPFDIPLDWNFTEQKIALPKEIGLDLLARRADLAMQIWLVQSASKEIHIAKTEFYPNINLSAFGGFQSLQFSNLFTHAGLAGFVSPAIHLPLFTGGKLKANLASKVSLFDKQVHTYNQMLLSAAEEVSTSCIELKKTFDLSQRSIDMLQDYLSMYNLHLSRFNFGLDTRLDVLEQENALLQAKIDLLENQLQYQLRSIALVKALGGGFYQPIDVKIEANYEPGK